MRYIITLLFLVSPFLLMAQSEELLETTAPSDFKVQFETSKGDFVVEVHREWAPLGADRFYQLVKSGFYTDIAIFRVQPEYVVQFGIQNDTVVNHFWDAHPLKDEPVKMSNVKGTLAYARDGAESRTTQLFINYHDNVKLDTVNFQGLQGFPPFGQVVDGMEVVESFYPEYGFEPAEYQDSVYLYGNKWLDDRYPELDYIYSVRVIE